MNACTLWRYGLALTTILFLGACGTSPPASYYTLSAPDIPYQQDKDGSITLGIGPIRVPEYLERGQIVTRRANESLKIDDFNRWAEPIADSQYRVIASTVDALLEDVVVIAYPYGRLADYDYRLVARIDRFDMDLAGETVLAVHWTITTVDGATVVPVRRARYTVSGGDVDDPGSVARAMNDCLEQFSRDIADRFASRLTATDTN